MARHRSALIVTLLAAVSLSACGRPSPTPPAQAAQPVAAPSTAARMEIGEDLSVREVQEGAFVITHAFPWPANSLLVEMKDGTLVLVDTPGTPEATRDVLDWAEARLGEREIIAIDTGYHYDNLGGNAQLVEQGIPVYGSDLTAQLLVERGEAVRALTLSWLQDPQYERYRQAHETLPYVPPTQLFPLEQGLQLAVGDETVQAYYPGPSHAPDNVVVYFPARRLLFGGCMVVGTDAMGNTSDADLAAWPGAVRDLEQFECDVVVPGHGNRLDSGLLQHTLDLLQGS